MPKFRKGAQAEREAAQREGLGQYTIRVGNTVFDYGRIDAYMSQNSLLNVTLDTYTLDDGLCNLSEAG